VIACTAKISVSALPKTYAQRAPPTMGSSRISRRGACGRCARRPSRRPSSRAPWLPFMRRPECARDAVAKAVEVHEDGPVFDLGREGVHVARRGPLNFLPLGSNWDVWHGHAKPGFGAGTALTEQPRCGHAAARAVTASPWRTSHTGPAPIFLRRSMRRVDRRRWRLFWLALAQRRQLDGLHPARADLSPFGEGRGHEDCGGNGQHAAERRASAAMSTLSVRRRVSSSTRREIYAHYIALNPVLHRLQRRRVDFVRPQRRHLNLLAARVRYPSR